MVKQKKLSILSLKASVVFILTFFLIILYFYFSSYFNLNNVSKAYITNQGDNTVSIIDLETLKTLKTLEVGRAPLGITILQKKKLGLKKNIELNILVVKNFTQSLLKIIQN